MLQLGEYIAEKLSRAHTAEPLPHGCCSASSLPPPTSAPLIQGKPFHFAQGVSRSFWTMTPSQPATVLVLLVAMPAALPPHVPPPPSPPSRDTVGCRMLRARAPTLGLASPWVRTQPLSRRPGRRTEHRQTDSNVSTHGQLTDTAAPAVPAARPPRPDSLHSRHAARGLGCGVGARGGTCRDWGPAQRVGSRCATPPAVGPWLRAHPPAPHSPTHAGFHHPTPASLGATLAWTLGVLGGRWAQAPGQLPEPRSPISAQLGRSGRLRTFYSAKLLLRCSRWAL